MSIGHLVWPPAAACHAIWLIYNRNSHDWSPPPVQKRRLRENGSERPPALRRSSYSKRTFIRNPYSYIVHIMLLLDMLWPGIFLNVVERFSSQAFIKENCIQISFNWNLKQLFLCHKAHIIFYVKLNKQIQIYYWRLNVKYYKIEQKFRVFSKILSYSRLNKSSWFIYPLSNRKSTYFEGSKSVNGVPRWTKVLNCFDFQRSSYWGNT